MDDDDADQKAFAAGGSGYLIKPFRPAMVLSQVHIHVELQRAKALLATFRDEHAEPAAPMAVRHGFHYAYTRRARWRLWGRRWSDGRCSHLDGGEPTLPGTRPLVPLSWDWSGGCTDWGHGELRTRIPTIVPG